MYFLKLCFLSKSSIRLIFVTYIK